MSLLVPKRGVSEVLTRIGAPTPFVTRVLFRAGVPSQLGEEGLREFFFPNFDPDWESTPV